MILGIHESNIFEVLLIIFCASIFLFLLLLLFCIFFWTTQPTYAIVEWPNNVYCSSVHNADAVCPKEIEHLTYYVAGIRDAYQTRWWWSSSSSFWKARALIWLPQHLFTLLSWFKTAVTANTFFKDIKSLLKLNYSARIHSVVGK